MITTTFHKVEEPAFYRDLLPWINTVVLALFESVESISYVFCSDDYLLNINQSQLNHNYYTDIITFDLRDKEVEPLSCEMYISIDRVKENSVRFNCTFAEELKRVMVHGLLHISGMNDATEAEQKKMREAENKYINYK